MDAPPDIIDRIKKLLRLARSSNPHEADLALQKALTLARQYHVDVGGLNPDQAEKSNVITHQETDPFARIGYEKRYAAAIAQRFFNVSAIVRATILVIDCWPREGRRVSFVGTEVDVQIALYVYVFLVRRFAFCWSHHRGRSRNRRAFAYGMFQGICSKLKEAEPPEEPHAPGLIVAARDAYIAVVFGKTRTMKDRTPDRIAQAAAWAGYVQGRQTEIRKPLDRPREDSLLLA